MSLTRTVEQTLFLASFGLSIVACNNHNGASRVIVDCNGSIADVALPADMMHGALGLVTLENSTKLAVDSGDWTDPCVWEEGTLPQDGERILIPEGVNVTIRSVIEPQIDTIGIHGSLQFDASADTGLTVHTLVSSTSGLLEIGTPEYPIDSGRSAIITFADTDVFSADEDAMSISRGATLMGQTIMNGAGKTHLAVLDGGLFAQDSTLVLSQEPMGWTIGDELVIAGTEINNPESDERRSIVGIDGTTIALDRPLEKDHVGLREDLPVHVVNMTRNIQFQSASSEIDKRGHVMFMHTLNVDVRHVSFINLGRTNKAVPLDDWYFPEFTSTSAEAGPATNIRGRYSVHFHRGGVDPESEPARVEGCVVDNDPGWAYVNHSSHVDFLNNVSYDVVGGAFQTEAGNEQGSFVGNVAVRTINPDYPIEDPATRPVDIREDSQDFAFQGDGFWIHGGGVRLENNIATGCSGHGFIFWTEGLREVDTQFDELNQFMTQHIPNGDLLDVDTLNTWWIPIAVFRGNQTYSVNKGLALYYVHSTLFEDVADVTPAYLEGVHSTFADTTIWNVGMMGVQIENSERFTFDNMRLVNKGVRDVLGISTTSTVGNRTIWKDVSVEGFDTGMLVPTQGDITIQGGTWSNDIDFLITPPQSEPTRQADNRDLRIDVTFSSEATPGIRERSYLYLVGEESLIGTWEANNEEDAHRLILIPDRIVLQSNVHPEQQVFFAEQASDYVPIHEAIIVEDAYGRYLTDVVGKTNQELWGQWQMSFAGAVLPSVAIPHDGIRGGLVSSVSYEPQNVPACLFINEEQPPMNTFDTFDFYACWEENAGSVSQVTSFDHRLD